MRHTMHWLLTGMIVIGAGTSGDAAPRLLDDEVKFQSTGNVSVEEFLERSQDELGFLLCYDPAEVKAEVALRGPISIPREHYVEFFESVLRGCGLVHYYFGEPDAGPHFVRRLSHLDESTLRSVARLVPENALKALARRQLWITTVIDLRGLDPGSVERVFARSAPGLTTVVLADLGRATLTGHASDVAQAAELLSILNDSPIDRRGAVIDRLSLRDVAGDADSHPRPAPPVRRSAFQDLCEVLENLEPMLDGTDDALCLSAVQVDGTAPKPRVELRGWIKDATQVSRALECVGRSGGVLESSVPKLQPAAGGGVEFSGLILRMEVAGPFSEFASGLLHSRFKPPLTVITTGAEKAGIQPDQALGIFPMQRIVHRDLGLAEQSFRIDGRGALRWMNLYAFLHNLDLAPENQVVRVELKRDGKDGRAAPEDSSWEWSLTMVCWSPLER